MTTRECRGSGQTQTSTNLDMGTLEYPCAHDVDMSRPPRVDFAGAIHHVVNRGVNHQRIFFSDIDRVEFGRHVAEIHRRHGVTILAYCLMDNHFHLVVRCPNGELSAAMQHLQSVFAIHVNERERRDGHLFKGRFFSALVTDDAYLLTVVRYVERNSLDLPGIVRPEDHRWSSHRRHLGLRAPVEWLETEFVLDCFGGLDAYESSIASDRSFSEPPRLDVRHLDGLARLSVVLHTPDHVKPSQLDRTITTALIPELSEPNRDLLVDVLGFSSRRTAQQATNRARRRLLAEPALITARDELRNLLFESSARILDSAA